MGEDYGGSDNDLRDKWPDSETSCRMVAAINPWDLCRADIKRAYRIAMRSSAYFAARQAGDPLMAVAWDIELCLLIRQINDSWDECGGDKTLMKLRIL